MRLHSRNDSLRALLTGATAAGVNQPHPAMSLGGYASSSRADSLGCILSNPILGLTINHVSSNNHSGLGALHASGDSLTWTAPGAAPGSPTSILPGETAVIEGADRSRFLLVTRAASATDPLAGDCAVQLYDVFNSAVAGANATLPTDKSYRCIALKNGPGQTIKNLKLWIAHADNPIRIAIDLPASQPDGAFQTITSESVSPAGLTFVAPVSAIDVNVISLATLPANNQIAIWIERDCTAAAASAKLTTELNWSYTAIG